MQAIENFNVFVDSELNKMIGENCSDRERGLSDFLYKKRGCVI